MTSQERVTAYAFTLAKIRKKLSVRNSIRTIIVTLDLSPTNSRCSNNVGLFAVSRTFLAHSVMYGQKKVKAGDIIYKGIYLRSTPPLAGRSPQKEMEHITSIVVIRTQPVGLRA